MIKSFDSLSPFPNQTFLLEKSNWSPNYYNVKRLRKCRDESSSNLPNSESFYSFNDSL